MRARFECQTVKLYQDILTAQLLLTLAYARSGFLHRTTQYARDIVKFNDWEGLETALSKRDNNITNFAGELGHAQTAEATNLFHELDKKVKKLLTEQKEQQDKILKELEELMNEKRSKKATLCLHSLCSELDYEERKNRVAERVPGTENCFHCSHPS